MKLKLFEMRGDYNICVRRAGQVRQNIDVHNLFTLGFISRLIGDVDYFGYCQLGSGSNVPSSSDTALSSRLWGVAKSSYTLTETSADGLSRTWTYTYLFPANSSYVGVVREVGLSAANSGQINTHALVVDAEGNPISINKTYLDEITITAKITITRPKWTSGQTWSFDSGPLSRAYLHGLLQTTTGIYNKHVLLSAQWCPEYRPIKNCQYTTLKTNLTYANGTIYCSAEFSGDAMFYYYDSSSGAKFADYVNSLLLGRSSSFSNPSNFIASYYATPPFRLLMPNSDLFPVTTLQSLALGTGDGVTTDFTPELPAWLEDTELVYNNGVLLTRNVDYQVDHLHNLQKRQSVMLGNFVAEIDAEKVFGVQGFIWGAYECTASTNNDDDWNSPVVRVNSPIIYKYGIDFAFTTKVNYFILGTWAASASIPAGASLVFYYSRDDGNSWTEFGRINHASAGTAFADTTEHTMSEVTGITHVKIALEDTTTEAYVRHSSHNGRFGYVGSRAIRFLTAPAVGDVLTMDAQIDRPWKSADNLIQWNPVLSFGV